MTHYEPETAGDYAAFAPQAAHAASEVGQDEPQTPIDWLLACFWIGGIGCTVAGLAFAAWRWLR